VKVNSYINLHVVDGARTPFSRIGTDLAEESASSLGVCASKHVISKSGIDVDLIDEVIFGCVGQPADSMNISRVIAVRSGVPYSVPAVTVHRNCASGFEAVTYACDKASAGKGDVFLVGGTENMSQMPLLYPYSAAKKFGALARAKTLSQKIMGLANFRPSDFSPEVGLKLGLSDTLCDKNMGETAEILAREFGITRTEQDAFSTLSHNKALLASDKLSQEICPVYTTHANCVRSPDGGYIDADNGPRQDSSVERLSRLRPVFDRKNGTVTAGNSSQITDGAASLLLMTDRGLEKTGCRSLGRIVDYAYSGCDPRRMGLGPVYAIEKLGVDIQQANLIEINEAFSAQVLAVQQFAKEKIGEIPEDKLNVNGGAIALGHPVGASGVRLILTIIKELRRRYVGNACGLVSLCVGGGQGGAIWLETCK
jgi:acetyl-CoA acetyltransferase family protein